MKQFLMEWLYKYEMRRQKSWAIKIVFFLDKIGKCLRCGWLDYIVHKTLSLFLEIPCDQCAVVMTVLHHKSLGYACRIDKIMLDTPKLDIVIRNSNY